MIKLNDQLRTEHCGTWFIASFLQGINYSLRVSYHALHKDNYFNFSRKSGSRYNNDACGSYATNIWITALDRGIGPSSPWRCKFLFTFKTPWINPIDSNEFNTSHQFLIFHVVRVLRSGWCIIKLLSKKITIEIALEKTFIWYSETEMR